MKQYPKIGSLVSGLIVLTFVNFARGQNLLTENRPPERVDSSTVVSCFTHVLERVLAGNFRLKSQAATLDALHLQTRQAALLPNPIITFEAENFGGSATDDILEYTGSVSQLIETGGKRHAREALAKANSKAFKLRSNLLTIELLAKARVAFSKVIAAKIRLRLSKQEVGIRTNALHLISRKSSHGGALKLEVEKAKVSLDTSKVIRDRRAQELQDANRELSSLWGNPETNIRLVPTEMRLDSPERELMASNERQLPIIAYANANRETARKAADFERSLAVPNVTVSAGYRRFDVSDDHGFVAGVSVPLPLFNRNQYSVNAADDRLKARQFDMANTRTTVNAELETLRNRLRLLLHERKLLLQRILPQTERVLAAATEGYRRGRINYLDYLDAQTTFIERRERLVTVTLSSIQSQVEIQRLSGTLLERLTQMDQGECNAE